jgi:membrane carboxypeptidase/penicillin-binding protein
LHIPNQEVAVKTGTTNDKRDNWTIGYTTDRLTAVWVGNNDNKPMSAVASGITGASPIWNKIMKELLQGQEAHRFEAPENLIKVKVCAWNGLLPCEGCPTKEEYFLPGTEPKYHCSSEQIKKIIEEREKKKEDKILEGVSTEREE